MSARASPIPADQAARASSESAPASCAGLMRWITGSLRQARVATHQYAALVTHMHQDCALSLCLVLGIARLGTTCKLD